MNECTPLEPGHAPSYPQPHDPFPTELQCYESLRKSAAGEQTKAKLEGFLQAVKPIALTTAECLNIMNLKPASDVEAGAYTRPLFDSKHFLWDRGCIQGLFGGHLAVVQG